MVETTVVQRAERRAASKGLMKAARMVDKMADLKEWMMVQTRAASKVDPMAY